MNIYFSYYTKKGWDELELLNNMPNLAIREKSQKIFYYRSFYDFFDDLIERLRLTFICIKYASLLFIEFILNATRVLLSLTRLTYDKQSLQDAWASFSGAFIFVGLIGAILIDQLSNANPKHKN